MNTVARTLRDVFLVGCVATEKEVQDSSYQCIKYVLTPSGELEATLALICDKWSRSDASTDAIAHHIDNNPNFLEPIMMREFDLVAKVAGSNW